jgi:signal transduction histidine kinase
MKFNSQYLTSLMLVVSVMLCLGTMYLIKFGEDKKRANTEELIKAQHIIEQTSNLLVYLNEVENGHRGFELTGDEAYLASCYSAFEEVEIQLQSLVELTVMSPGIQAILVYSTIPKLMNQRAVLEGNIHAGYWNQKEFSIELANSNTHNHGVYLINEVRKDILEIRERTEQEMIQRSDSLNKAYFWYNNLAYGGLIFIGLSIVFGIFLIRNYDQQKNELIDDLAKSNEELSRLNKREVALREEKNRFLGIAAHDLRNPLNSIIALSDILKQESDHYEEEHREYIGYIIESANQMNSLIDHFLDVHRSEDQGGKPKIERVNILNLLQALLFKFENKAKKKDITIHLDSELKSDHVMTNKSIFSQVVDNLISNAVKFSPFGKNVRVRLRDSDEGFTLEVEDEGYGIKESEKSKLFRKYQTLSTRPTGGEKSVGLGLSIVFDQMAEIGGHVMCESVEGEGATFIAHFPGYN